MEPSPNAAATPAAEPPGAVLLIRHGQSEWNAAKRWQGMADSPLTDLGRAQATAAAERLAALAEAHPGGLDFGELWSSQLGRAQATAAVIGAHLGLTGPQIEPRLREVGAGPWEGLTLDEIEAGWPGYLEAHRRPDGFEDLDTVLARALEALTVLGQRALVAGRPLIAVTHSGVMRAVRSHFGETGQRVGNLDGCWITARPAGDAVTVGLGPMLVLIDDALSTPGGFEQRR